MKLIALTGGIATGKSTVAHMFEKLGAVVLQADRAAHEVYRRGSPVYQKIKHRYGKKALDKSGRIDRKKLAGILFGSKQEKAWLEALIHPATFFLLGEKMRRALRKAPPLILVEAALHFESGFYRFFPATVLVDADETTQLRRLQEREGLSEKEARRRIKSQMPMAKKRLMADFSIDNCGSLAKTRRQVERLYKDWTGRSPSRKKPRRASLPVAPKKSERNRPRDARHR